MHVLVSDPNLLRSTDGLCIKRLLNRTDTESFFPPSIRNPEPSTMTDEHTAAKSISNVGKREKKKKVKRNKRRRISKHVLKSKEKAAAEEGKTSVEEKKRKETLVKDPGDVNGYLINWQKHQNGDTEVWKFNKNTQSWLIRHMYEVDKVPKSTFSILLLYLDGLKSPETRSRMLADATRRALRYKKFEESLQKIVNAPSSDQIEEEQPLSSDQSKKQPSQEDRGQDDDFVRWNKLDEHGKRKEYKRARKVLEILTQKT